MIPRSAASGLIVAAPASGSGKTVITLGLPRHWARSGVAGARPLFRCTDSGGKGLGEMGLAANKVMGSFIHLIDRVA